MAERWQQWMPFHIDRFRGSMDVQAMAMPARMGYLYLLCDAWQSPDCTIPEEPMELADRSGLGDELWAIHGRRILRKFTPAVGAPGRLENLVLRAEWLEARRVFEARQSGARMSAKHRSARGEREVSVRTARGEHEVSVSRADTQTGTGTVTGTEVQKTSAQSDKPLRAGAAPPIAILPCVGAQRVWELSRSKLEEWQASYPGVDVMAEVRTMRQWLLDNPIRQKTHAGMTRFIGGWLSTEQNKPRLIGGGSHGAGGSDSNSAAGRIAAGVSAARAAAQRSADRASGRAAGEHDRGISPPEVAPGDGGIPDGLRGPGAGVRPGQSRGGFAGAAESAEVFPPPGGDSGGAADYGG